MIKTRGKDVGPQVVISHDSPHQTNDLRHSHGRDSVIVPFRQRLRTDTKQARERHLRATGAVATSQSPVSHGLQYVRLELTKDNKKALCKEDRTHYYQLMVDTNYLPKPPSPKKFRTLAAWISAIIEQTRGAQALIARELGVHPASVAKYAQGRLPRAPKIIKLADMFDINRNELFELASNQAAGSPRINQNSKTVMHAEVLYVIDSLPDDAARRHVIEQMRALVTLLGGDVQQAKKLRA